MNPWGLTPQEAAALDALIQAGCKKRACDLIGVAFKTYDCYITSIRVKMGLRGKGVFAHVLLWDRFRRQQ